MYYRYSIPRSGTNGGGNFVGGWRAVVVNSGVPVEVDAVLVAAEVVSAPCVGPEVVCGPSVGLTVSFVGLSVLLTS